MEDTIGSMVETINQLEAENAALKIKVEKFTSYNKQSTPCCISCGNTKCSMQAGVCAKWQPVV